MQHLSRYPHPLCHRSHSQTLSLDNPTAKYRARVHGDKAVAMSSAIAAMTSGATFSTDALILDPVQPPSCADSNGHSQHTIVSAVLTRSSQREP
jgi:hypothetical protein